MNVLVELFEMPLPRFTGTDLLFIQRCRGRDVYIDVKKDPKDKLDSDDEPSSSATYRDGKPDIIPEEHQKPISYGPHFSKCIKIFTNMFQTEERRTGAE